MLIETDYLMNTAITASLKLPQRSGFIISAAKNLKEVRYG